MLLEWGEPRHKGARQKLPGSGACHSHRVAEGGRDLWGSPGPSPPPGRATRSRCHGQRSGVWGRRLRDLSGQPARGSACTTQQRSPVLREPPVPQLVPAAFPPVPGHPGVINNFFLRAWPRPAPRMPGPFLCSEGTVPAHAPRPPQGPQTPFLPRCLSTFAPPSRADAEGSGKFGLGGRWGGRISARVFASEPGGGGAAVPSSERPPGGSGAPPASGAAAPKRCPQEGGPSLPVSLV